jgi:hypothetical protein
MILALRTPRPFGVPIGKSRGLVACGSSASPIPYTKLKKPASRAGFLYLAVLAVWCEPVSDQVPCNKGKIQGIFSGFDVI